MARAISRQAQISAWLIFTKIDYVMGYFYLAGTTMAPHQKRLTMAWNLDHKERLFTLIKSGTLPHRFHVRAWVKPLLGSQTPRLKLLHVLILIFIVAPSPVKLQESRDCRVSNFVTTQSSIVTGNYYVTHCSDTTIKYLVNGIHMVLDSLRRTGQCQLHVMEW